MEYAHRRFNFNLRKKVHGILSRVSARRGSSTLSSETIKTLRGLLFLFVALFLAWLSAHTSESVGAEDFKKHYALPRRAWTRTLEDQGFHLEPVSEKWEGTLKSLPHSESSEGEVFVSEDACLLYLGHTPNQETPELWACGSTPTKAPQWVALGAGLNAFEKLMKFMEKHPRLQRPAKKIGPKFIDPKEFHY